MALLQRARHALIGERLTLCDALLRGFSGVEPSPLSAWGAGAAHRWVVPGRTHRGRDHAWPHCVVSA